MKNLKKEKKKLIEFLKGSIDKFVISNKQNITQNLDENITNEQKIMSLKYMHCLQDFTNNTCYNSFCRKKFFKIKINKIKFKINYVIRLSGLTILSIKKGMLTELKCKNLISNFVSQKTRKINFN